MAVVVRISINDNRPALHVIEIRRISDTEVLVPDPDLVCEYQVTDYAASHKTYLEHRYGDPVEDLVIQALTLLKREH